MSAPYSLWVCPDGHTEEHPLLPVHSIRFCLHAAKDVPEGVVRMCGYRMSRRVRDRAHASGS